MKALLIVFFFSMNSFANEKIHYRMRAHRVAHLKATEFSASDIKAEIEFGKGLAARILSKYPLVEDQIIQAYVNTLGSGVASILGRPELNFYFAVIDTPDVNAYACPGGYIFITKGLIKLISNEAELVGVIGHEIAHVNERHVIKKLKIKGKDDSAISGLGAMIGGATASFRVAIKTLAEEAMNILFNEGLMESEELSADKTAILGMHASGYKVSAWSALLLKLKASMEQQNAKVLSKTHPKVQERLKLIKIFEKKNKVKNEKLNEERFKRYVNF